MSREKDIPAAFSGSDATERYGDILFRERPVHDGDLFSRRHPRMSRLNRAKIFAPFAALAGFDARVRRKEIAYVPKAQLDADEAWALNRKLDALHGLTADSGLARANRVGVRIEYFELCDDEESEACGVKGQYKTVAGIVRRVDAHEQRITVDSGGEARSIPFEDIYRIDVE